MSEHALIIGIDHYADAANIPKLSWAREDAQALHDVLRSPLFWGIPERNTALLVDENATRENILKCIEHIGNHAAKDDTVIIHFSGHGCSAPDDKGDEDDRLLKYLVPYDAQTGNLISSAINFKFLPSYLDFIKSERTIITLDCCYSGAAGGRTFLEPGIRQVGSLPVGKLFLQNASGVGRAIITACAGNEVAREDSRIHHGILSHSLIEGLKGEADFRNDGIVDFDELWLYLANAVPRVSSNEQHPVMVGWAKGPSLVLTRPRTIPPTEEQKKRIETKLVLKYADCRLQTVRIADNDSVKSLALEAAQYLDEHLTNVSKISVSCGTTLSATISQLREKDLHYVDMFPLNAYRSEVVETIDSNVLTSLLKTKISGTSTRAHLFPIFPLEGLSENARNEVEQVSNRRASKAFARAKKSDLFLLGIGQPAAPNANVAYALHQANLTPAKLQEMGAVGEVNFHLYDKDGEFLVSKSGLPQDQKDYLDRYYRQFIAFGVQDLKDVARKAGVNVVAVAGGEDKHQAILAVIRRGLVRTLITDAETAQWLADEAEV